MKILVKTALSPYSGYGNDGIGLVSALVEAGLDVYLDPSAVSAPLPENVYSLLSKRLVAPFDLIIQHADPAQLGLTDQARDAAVTTVGWTMWEYTTLDNLKGRTRLRKSLKVFDLMLGYDAVTADCLRQYTKGKVGVLQGGIDPSGWPMVERDWTGDRFAFCMVGQLHERKDPFVAIQAFKELKDEYPEEFDGAELHLKTNVPGLHSAMEQWIPKLRVHYATWPTETLRAFYESMHCLLAPSRGEGKNVPALEMLCTGGTVIATNWGGHTGWMSSEYAYPLDYVLRPAHKSTPNCMNARASKDHLKDLMLHVYRNRAEAHTKGARGAATIPLMCSWPSVVERLFQTLRAETDDGQRLYAAYQQAKASSGRDTGQPVHD